MKAEAEIARLRAEFDVAQRERDDAYLVHSNTKQLLEHVVRERDEAHQIIEHEREMRIQSEINYRCVKDKLDEARAQVAVLIQDLQAALVESTGKDHSPGQMRDRVRKVIDKVPVEARSLLDRIKRAEAVVKTAKRWVVRKGHGAEGHHCDLCEALAEWEERME